MVKSITSESLSPYRMLLIGLLAIGAMAMHVSATAGGVKGLQDKKRELAIKTYKACMSEELASEKLRPSFALVLGRGAHLQDEAMRGTTENLGTSLCITQLENLQYWHNEKQITLGVKTKALLSVSSPHIVLDERIKDNRKYLVGFAAEYLLALADDFAAVFPERKLKATSLLRTPGEQRLIAKRHMSPLDCKPAWYCSAHTTGATVDISLRNLTVSEIEFLRVRIRADIARLRILAIKEEKNGCFHIQVLNPDFVSAALNAVQRNLPKGQVYQDEDIIPPSPRFGV